MLLLFSFLMHISLLLRPLAARFTIVIRMERQRREDELKGRSSKKGQDAEQSLLNRVCLYLIIDLDFSHWILLSSFLYKLMM